MKYHKLLILAAVALICACGLRADWRGSDHWEAEVKRLTSELRKTSSALKEAEASITRAGEDAIALRDLYTEWLDASARVQEHGLKTKSANSELTELNEWTIEQRKRDAADALIAAKTEEEEAKARADHAAALEDERKVGILKSKIELLNLEANVVAAEQNLVAAKYNLLKGRMIQSGYQANVETVESWGGTKQSIDQLKASLDAAKETLDEVKKREREERKAKGRPVEQPPRLPPAGVGGGRR